MRQTYIRHVSNNMYCTYKHKIKLVIFLIIFLSHISRKYKGNPSVLNPQKEGREPEPVWQQQRALARILKPFLQPSTNWIHHPLAIPNLTKPNPSKSQSPSQPPNPFKQVHLNNFRKEIFLDDSISININHLNPTFYIPNQIKSN